MGMRCLPIFIFIFLQRANLIGPSLKRKMKLLRLPKIEGSILKSRVPPPFAHLYRWKEDNIFPSTWDQSEVLWRTCWGTHWKPDVNSLEHSGNTLEPGEIFLKSSPPQNLKGKKSKAPWVLAWAFPLAAWNFSSQKSLSLFLAWPNTPC